jgi:iron complex outermembrane recepter protein
VHSSGVFANFSVQHMAAYPINDANTVDNEAFTVVHMQGGYRRSVGKTLFEIRAGMQNLLDTQYASMTLVNATAFGGALPRYYYPGSPRSWYIGISVSF